MRDFYKTAFAILSLLTSAPFASRADVKCAALLFVGKKKYEVAELQG